MGTSKQAVKGYGVFTKKGNYVYRTEAYLQWGLSEKTIGTVIMLNPGTASEKGRLIENELQCFEVNLDPTMHTIVSVINKAYKDQPLEGRVYIYNLFALQNPRDREAIHLYNELWSTNEPLICDLPMAKEELLQRFNEGSWIWLAWGCEESSKRLRDKKELFFNLVNESNAKIIGLKGNSKLKYYHPLARIPRKNEKFVEQFEGIFVYS